jgi:hypothetical protein
VPLTIIIAWDIYDSIPHYSQQMKAGLVLGVKT